MTDTPETSKEALTLPATLRQPLLNELGSGERIVRVMGLKFILPCAFKRYMTLNDQWIVDFLNTAWHTAVINRFTATVRDELLKNPALTYEQVEEALIRTFDEFEWEGRPTKPPRLVDIQDDNQKARIKYARPLYNAAMKGHSLDRAEYELKLFEWTEQNVEVLDEMRSASETKNAALRNMLAAAGFTGENP